MNDPWFLIPKALYFLLNWLIYSTHAFLFQFCESTWAIDKANYSFANMFQLANFFGAILWGGLADRTGKYKSIIMGCAIMYTISMLGLAYPIFLDNTAIKLAYFYLLNAASFFFAAGTFSLVDSIVLSMLASSGAGKEIFGRQRLWGTVSHSIAAYVIHKAYHWIGDDYHVMFYSLTTTVLLFTTTLAFGIPGDLKVEAHKGGHHGHHGGSNKPKQQQLTNDSSASVATVSTIPEERKESSTKTLLTSPSFLFFLSVIMSAGIVRCVNTIFQSMYITEEIGMSKEAVGEVILVRLPFEVGLYFFAKELMALMGPYWFMIVGQAAGIIRIAGYLLVPRFSSSDAGAQSGWIYWLYALEALKGINSSMVISSAAKIGSDMAPEGCSGSAQTLISGVWQGLSMFLAAGLGYIMMEKNFLAASLSTVFTVTAVVGVVSLSLIGFKYAFIDRTLFRRHHSGTSKV